MATGVLPQSLQHPSLFLATLEDIRARQQGRERLSCLSV